MRLTRSDDSLVVRSDLDTGSVQTFSHFRFFAKLRKVVGLMLIFRGPDVQAAKWSGQIRFACYAMPG